jgi:hypothetical protein
MQRKTIFFNPFTTINDFPHNLYEIGGKIIYKDLTLEAVGFKKSYDQWEEEELWCEFYNIVYFRIYRSRCFIQLF